MTLTNLEKYLYSKKCFNNDVHPTPTRPSLQGIFAPKKSPGYGCYLQLNMPIQQIELQNVPFIVYLERLIPTAQDQQDYNKSAEFLNNCHKLLNIYNWTKLHILVLSHCPWVVPG